MRRRVVLFCAVALLAAGLVWAAGEMLTVQVRSGKMRSRPSFLGQVVGEMTYGEQVTVLEQQGPWIRISGPGGQSGWLHESALSENKVEMSAGDQNVETSASDDELALAGKGFTEQVEAEYMKQNEDLDFTWVDRMEKIVVTPPEAELFLVEGQVVVGEGGR